MRYCPGIISVALFAGILSVSAEPAATPDLAPVKKWIEQQAAFRTISADFTQTRTLRTVRKPLVSQGHLWFSAPNSLRWEVGTPPETIVLRKNDSAYIITPREKKAKLIDLAGGGADPGAQAFAMMDFRMAKSFAEFNRQYQVTEIQTANGQCSLSLLPKNSDARKMLKSINMAFNIGSGALVSMEMVFKNNSSLRNDFSTVRINPGLPKGIFDFDLTGYEVADGKR